MCIFFTRFKRPNINVMYRGWSLSCSIIKKNTHIYPWTIIQYVDFSAHALEVKTTMEYILKFISHVKPLHTLGLHADLKCQTSESHWKHIASCLRIHRFFLKKSLKRKLKLKHVLNPTNNNLKVKPLFITLVDIFFSKSDNVNIKHLLPRNFIQTSYYKIHNS